MWLYSVPIIRYNIVQYATVVIVLEKNSYTDKFALVIFVIFVIFEFLLNLYNYDKNHEIT